MGHFLCREQLFGPGGPVPFSSFLQNIFRRLSRAFAHGKPQFDPAALIGDTLSTFAEDLARYDDNNFGTMPREISPDQLPHSAIRACMCQRAR
jgi:hypothetical protein